MPAIVLTQFKVQDQAKWREHYDNHADFRKEHGCLGTHVFYNAKDPNEVIINLQWDTEENANKFLASPELQKVMADAGVIGAPQIWFLEEGGRTPS